jgi:hypothetical protein
MLPIAGSRKNTADQNGKFILIGIAPGGYRVLSWDSFEETGWCKAHWYDSGWLKPRETKRESVHLEEFDRKSGNLKLVETHDESPASN